MKLIEIKKCNNYPNPFNETRTIHMTGDIAVIECDGQLVNFAITSISATGKTIRATEEKVEGLHGLHNGELVLRKSALIRMSDRRVTISK